ncbi:MAG: segregation/condensation protein A [Clostridia bacterium]
MIDSYNIVIDNFTGPLDLLLNLIAKNKMNIFDINLSDLTDKYIEYLESMEELDLNITSEFIVMAATLLNIKSKKLLPVDIDTQDEDVISEEEMIQKIINYKKYKEISVDVLNMYNENFGVFNIPFRKLNKIKLEYLGDKLDVNNLSNIYFDIIDRNKNKMNIKSNEIDKLVINEKITVKDKVIEILNYLKKSKKIVFNTLFNKKSKTDIVTGFLGILELSKLKKIKCNQDKTFSDIILTRADSFNVDIDLENILE